MIGPFLWTPEEAYALAFPDSPAPGSELRVISYVLPQTPETRADQRLEETMPTERWARSRFHGEEFNCDLRLHLAETLTGAGYPSVAPERLPGFSYRQSERFGLASNWSERHAAFVAGHGTFSLSDAMITRWGKAVRFGSVVSRIDLPVTKRVYGNDHHAWCLWYAKGTCGACAKRCPADAITTSEGHDKQGCFTYIKPTAPVPRPAACARSKSLVKPRCHRRCSKNVKTGAIILVNQHFQNIRWTGARLVVCFVVVALF